MRIKQTPDEIKELENGGEKGKWRSLSLGKKQQQKT